MKQAPLAFDFECNLLMLRRKGRQALVARNEHYLNRCFLSLLLLRCPPVERRRLPLGGPPLLRE